MIVNVSQRGCGGHEKAFSLGFGNAKQRCKPLLTYRPSQVKIAEH